MTDSDYHKTSAECLAAIANLEALEHVKQQITDSWVDAIDDVGRLRALVKDKSNRLTSMVEKLDEIRWHYEERELRLRESEERHRSISDRLTRTCEHQARVISKRERMLHTLTVRAERRLKHLAKMLGVEVPNKRAWKVLIDMVRAKRV